MLRGVRRVLAIETSCDDTAVAVVDSARRILSERTVHQHPVHARFRGIVPYLASRAHRAALPRAVHDVLRESGCLSMRGIDAVAATRGPGIAGSLTIGHEAGRMLALVHNLPFYSVHHMEAHALITRIDQNISFPFLALLVSGGHTLLVLAQGLADYVQLGSTLDCTVGQAVDRAARALGLEYDATSGPAASMVRCALAASRDMVPPELAGIPVSSKLRESLDFSFSGLITAFERIASGAEKKEPLAVAFLDACSEQLADRCVRALRTVSERLGLAITHLVVCGGVARNDIIYDRIRQRLFSSDFKAVTVTRPTNPEHCVDNAAMVGWTALEYAAAGLRSFSFNSVRDQWPLQDLKLDLLTSEAVRQNITNI